VVDALLTLNERGSLRPTARDIAQEAGVSLRSLYVHFDDLEALFVAAGHRHAERMGAILPPLVDEGTFAERLDGCLRRRLTAHEAGGAVRRAALLQEPFSPAIHQAMTAARQGMRAETTRMFAPELAACDAAAKSRLARAIDIATGAATWDSLRTYQGLSVDEATAQVRDMVLAFISAWVPDPRGDGSAVATTTTTTEAGPRA
jgi:AcrR family transcriptional regulator